MILNKTLEIVEEVLSVDGIGCIGTVSVERQSLKRYVIRIDTINHICSYWLKHCVKSIEEKHNINSEKKEIILLNYETEIIYIIVEEL